MLSVLKKIFVHDKDYAGRDVNVVIERLAAQTSTSIHAWSYIREHSIYENTQNGMTIYPHELKKYAA
ncbi:hypothetical protein NF212_11525 [Parasalinivibrio latis]|uniref:hypothetical protein n=1 Tax=Parasalinivibrio latis TaxID=2952610 RepID=UPI0030E2A618